MKKHLVKRHISYHISLLFLFFAGFFLAVATGYDKKTQMTIISMIALLYVTLGIVHHHANHNLSSKIVVEYVLIASLGITVMLFLLRGFAL
ncbi:MAG: hypothetical protein HYT10_00505 [Candidatus Levybacteria bacterium]|nr:hypothetical protein [Candidatus Levybacteria bacterium]